MLLATATLAGASTRAIEAFPLLPALQTTAASAIPSNAPGALPRPEEWDCERIYPEYRDWLEAGNAPADWRHVGKTYRDVEDAELYSWNDWLEWAERAECPGFAQLQPEFAPLVIPATSAIISSAVAALGAPVLASTLGGNDSPG